MLQPNQPNQRSTVAIHRGSNHDETLFTIQVKLRDHQQQRVAARSRAFSGCSSVCSSISYDEDDFDDDDDDDDLDNTAEVYNYSSTTLLDTDFPLGYTADNVYMTQIILNDEIKRRALEDVCEQKHQFLSMYTGSYDENGDANTKYAKSNKRYYYSYGWRSHHPHQQQHHQSFCSRIMSFVLPYQLYD